ncbi:adenosine deaminase [Vibrio mangrovi]|uniref:Adenosine deaminase n=1 Tax=Vibrio mangrovi TaxID=474394 RepID=A0A1Y6IS55_9VIBR|nr:adenosine deaminase [Vibrio mangrovi]MDW6003349.1 adenosine deaminase [Vibrio mangrovi]SMR99861.1 hypothetical protein VIM7927_01095 [Vibrio mangrovi]
MSKKQKKSPEKNETQSDENKTRSVHETRKKIEEILDKRAFDKQFEL